MDSMYLVIALGAAVAGFVQGLSGFAFGMVAMSFWAWVLPPQEAAALSVFGSPPVPASWRIAWPRA